ncbi:hypothetical protein BRC90_08720 [Halobacteriales archaeon QS_4_69_34]|nr:MAG: hypothetical protein BRC90_08720 [Halobacteriales archaeon QS_4_69_34]
MGTIAVVVAAFWAMLPAYVPNNAAVLAGGGRPIDGGRTWRGRRLLGDGKTWRGATAGVVSGTALALVQDALAAPFSGTIDLVLPGFPVVAAVALPLGAVAGDVAASFLKRRLDRERGAVAPGLDQLDFAVGALAFAALAAPAWFGRVFSPPALLAVVVLTPLLHVGTNLVAYRAGLKGEPW